MTQATVLYVDDEAMALKYFDRLISPNFKVLTAISVEDGIKQLQAHGADISVLISDQRMPGTNGNELLRYTRHHHPHIVRLLTTAYSELGDAIVAINAGEIYRYITKPWDIDMLRTEVRLAVEVASLRTERDELLHAKIQVVQSQLLANRVNNLALTCGLENANALHQFFETSKQLGGVALDIDWRTLHYTDWMQAEATRHAAIGHTVTRLAQQWANPSLADLEHALGTSAFEPQHFTALLSGSEQAVTESHCAYLAWLIALHRAGQQQAAIAAQSTGDSHAIQVSLSPQTAVKTLARDWLAGAMEDLETRT